METEDISLSSGLQLGNNYCICEDGWLAQQDNDNQKKSPSLGLEVTEGEISTNREEDLFFSSITAAQFYLLYIGCIISPNIFHIKPINLWLSRNTSLRREKNPYLHLKRSKVIKYPPNPQTGYTHGSRRHHYICS